MKARRLIFSVLCVAGFVLTSQAQPTELPPTTGDLTDTPPCWPIPCVPIDGGLGFLIVAGAAVGIRGLSKANRKLS